MNPAHEHFERRAEIYAKTATERPEFRERFSIFGRRITKAADSGASKRRLAVDLGCGAGQLTVILAASGYETVAVDGSRAMLELTRDRLNEAGFIAKLLQQASLPFPVDEVPYKEEVSLIVASSIIEYVERDDVLLAQCSQMLKRDGRLLASFPNERSLYWIALTRLRKFGLLSGRDMSRQAHQYTPDSIKRLAGGSGLTLESYEYFSLPFQRYFPELFKSRHPRIATMFVAELRPHVAY
jgi:2-polyprenyl-3-methyl-5-hydroxy-6-metoxy-1,4-benzoquinol methylase